MTASAWDKFLLLSWKNWIIQLRHPIQTVFEIAVPVIVCALLILIRGLIDVTVYENDFTFEPMIATHINPRILWDSSLNLELAYSPDNPILREIVQHVTDDLNLSSIVAMNDPVALESYAISNKPFASIEFDQSLQNETELPKIMNYALRLPAELRGLDSMSERFAGFIFNWATNFRLSNEFAMGPRNRLENDGGLPPGYVRQGFIALQNAIDRHIIYATANVGSRVMPSIYIQRYPYPSYVDDVFSQVMEFFIPFLLLIAFLYNCINNIKYITIEKELQLKESMKIMGLPNYMHWIAWFTKCMIFQVIIISIVTGMFKVKFQSQSGLAVFTHTDWTVLWLFFFLYSLTIVTYSFMFSVFFSKANIASIVGAIFWFVMLLPYNLTAASYNTLSLNMKWAGSLLCNSGMAFGFKVMSQYESAGVGVQWSNLFEPISIDDDLVLGHILVIFLITSTIQILITLYVEKISPGEFGVPEKWYFPVTIKFWTGRVAIRDDIDNLDLSKKSNFEEEPIDKKAGIQVRGLRKVYNKKVAVDNLNLNMYEDQITVLLGHNGAGKSTTMGMLTGLFPPSSGTAYIDGKDIRTDLNSVRSSLGLCPQHNVLFNELTVKEHITFFSKLKGLKKKSEIDEQIRKYVQLLELTPKLNAQSTTLSGGMKRKLSIGIALCGNSKIVMCDEPSSGLDPSARRALWDLLIQEKKGRTILLTTHFMDEADVLGDRIAIMADGDLKTVGTSFFLKKKFGVGYRLVCVKGTGCDPVFVTKTLSKYIPDIKIETDIGSELTYVLHESKSSIFKEVFSDLENNSDRLKISSYGVSLTTLEEVFLKVGSDCNALVSKEHKSDGYDFSNGGSNSTLGGGVGSTDFLNVSTSLLHGTSLYMSQIEAMAIKKFFYQIRNYKMLLIQLLIPALFVVLTMLSDAVTSGDQDLPALALSFNEYLQTETTAQKGDMSENQNIANIFENFQELFKDLPSASQHVLTVTENDMEQHILEEYRASIAKANLNFMIGASFSNDNITAWFNNQAYHTAPLVVNTVNNAILRAFSGNDRSINIVNKPLPFTIETRINQLSAGNNLSFQIAFNTGFAFAFVSALFVIFYIKERVSKAKLLQYVSGANKIIFWMVSFALDYAQFIIISLIYIGALAAYQREGYSTYPELARIFLVILFFGYAMLPFTYVGSFLFQVPSTGLIRLSIGYMITGIFFFMAYFILSVDILNLEYIAKPLGWIFLIFPHFSLSRAISNLSVKQTIITTCDRQCALIPFCTEQIMCTLEPECCDRNIYTFKEDGIGVSLTALLAIGVISFAVLFALEYRFIQTIFYKLKKSNRPVNIPESEDGIIDSDVNNEKIKVRSVTSFLTAKNNLVLKDFTKYYGKLLAVNQICVGVERSECFGLLGVNGAGKTSTFQMLTGDEMISAGDAWVDGISIRTDMNKVHRRIGYCPQFDALIDDLTGRETLRIFSLLRGVPRSQIASLSKQLAEDLSFTKHLDKKIIAYSGGNKRKLSTALSLIGDPSVIYLDEPTSGMDPGARRQLWNMVIKARNAGKSVILTSHSMEECEALCTRLAIMVNGEFKCLGSTQHLKNKFSKGFFLTIKIGQEAQGDLTNRIANIKAFISQAFSGAILKEEYMDILTYHIPVSSVKWSEMFGLMEEAKTRLNISDYSLGQTSLEQVFLFLTKHQRISK